MKKYILIIPLLLGSVLNLKAQIYTPSGTIAGSSGTNNIGIGTASPAAKLHIVSGALNEPAFSITGSINAMTSTPMNAVSIAPTIRDSWDQGQDQRGVLIAPVFDVEYTYLVTAYGLKIAPVKSTVGPSTYIETAYALHVSATSIAEGSITNNYTAIFTGGNVGIGTTTPQTLLTVGNQNAGTGEPTYKGTIQIQKYGEIVTNGGGLEFKVSSYSNGYGWHIGAFHVGNEVIPLVFSSRKDNASWTERMRILDNGNVGIGNTSPAYKLDVCGTIRAKEVKIDLDGNCPDFVFKSDYKLMDLKDLEEFVKTNNHLPEIAPEKEMLKNGINIMEFQLKLLQKIEELTLYTIEQNKKIIELEKQNQRIKALEEKIEKLLSLSN